MTEITIKYSKTVQGNPNLKAALVRPMQLATAVAHHIRDRVAQGRFATAPEPYSTTPTAGDKNDKGYFISEQYAALAGTGKNLKFTSSAAFHAKANAKVGNTTGNLLKSIIVRNYGGNGSVVEPSGSSLGASRGKPLKIRGQKRLNKKDESGQNIYKARNVRNALKAASVFRSTGIGILQVTDPEVEAMCSAVASWGATAVATAFGIKSLKNVPSGDMQLYQRILRGF